MDIDSGEEVAARDMGEGDEGMIFANAICHNAYIDNSTIHPSSLPWCR